MFQAAAPFFFLVNVDVKGDGKDRVASVTTVPQVDYGDFATDRLVLSALGENAASGLYGFGVIGDVEDNGRVPGVTDEELARVRGFLAPIMKEHCETLSSAVAAFPDSDLIACMAEAVFNMALDEALWGERDDDDSGHRRKLPKVEEISVKCGSLLPEGQTYTTREDRASFFRRTPVEVYREDGEIRVACLSQFHWFFTYITSELVKRVKETLKRDVAQYVVRRLAREAADRHRDQMLGSAIAERYGVSEEAVEDELRLIEEREEIGKYEEACSQMAREI
jgi:hypothetical protein